MPAVNKSERNCKPTRRDPEQKLLLLCVGHGRFCHSFLLVQTQLCWFQSNCTAQGCPEPSTPSTLAEWQGLWEMCPCCSPTGKGQMVFTQEERGEVRFFCYINLAKGKKKNQNSSFEFLGRQGQPSCTVQPQIIAAFGLINSRTPLIFTFLAPQTADGFVICFNNYCNKEANSVGWRIFFHNIFSCIVYTIYFTICSIIRGLDNHLVVSAT